ncbi:MAG: hypothetical protein SGI83_05565 [Bacteroidota bacterium]|nr:hypothetical protein [Bacteroidota bacterium]
MKRTPLLILGLLFLLLCVACLFYPDHSSNLHLALVIELVFFIQFALTKKSRAIPEPQEINSTHHRVELKEAAVYELEAVEAEVQEIH